MLHAWLKRSRLGQHSDKLLSEVGHLVKREKSAGSRAMVECSGRSRLRWNDLLESMAPRCVVHNDMQSEVK